MSIPVRIAIPTRSQDLSCSNVLGPMILSISTLLLERLKSSLPNGIYQVTLNDIDVFVFWESIHFEPCEFLQSVPEDRTCSSCSDTTY